MRYALCFATTLFLLACGDIVPVEQVDLCKGDNPPSNDCAQCKTKPFAAECPKCRHQKPDDGCENASSSASGGAGGSGGASGANGGGGGSGGSSGTGVIDGGSGGVMAMDAGPDAAIDSGHSCEPCLDGSKFCAGDVCAQCLKDGDCGDDAPHCDKLATHACVQCVNDKQCQAQGMVCDEDKHTCVPCVLDSDCKDPKLPQCMSNVCSTCNSQTACEGREGFGNCDSATGSATKGQCVECLAHSDCKNPTPQCNTKRQCVACSGSDEACVGRDGAEVCDEDDWSEKKGTCVECTGAKYAGCKVGPTKYVCDSLKRKCSKSEKEHSSDACMPCVSDAQCQTGRVCVKETFDDPTDVPDQGTIDVGYFCAWDLSSANGPNGDCFNESPFVHQVSGASTVDHDEADVCVLRVSTCPAYTHFSDKDCAPSGTPDDNACGDPRAMHDGYCVMAGPTTYRCTMPCGGNDDCKTGFTCDTAANPDVCSL